MMTDPAKLRELAEAAGHLCCAHSELVAAGYAAWAVELGALIESLEVEIVRLEEWEPEEIWPVPHY